MLHYIAIGQGINVYYIKKHTLGMVFMHVARHPHLYPITIPPEPLYSVWSI